MTFVRWWWLGAGTSPAGQGVSRKTAQRTGALGRQERRSREGRQIKRQNNGNWGGASAALVKVKKQTKVAVSQAAKLVYWF